MILCPELPAWYSVRLRAMSKPTLGSSLPSQTNLGCSRITLPKKYTPTFEVEVDAFLSTLEIERSELDHVSIADLRHKLEKQKKRKLTSEEKKFFKEKTSDYIFSLFCEDDNSSGELTSHKEDRSQTCELNSSQELDLYLDTSPTQRDRKNSQTNGDSQCASVISNYLLDVTKTPQSKKGKQDKKQTLQNKPDSKGSIQRDKNRGFEKNKNHHPLSCVKTVDLVEDEDCLMSPNAITRRGRVGGRGRKVTATRGGKSVKGGRGRSRGSAISAGQVSGVCPTSASTSKESSIYCDHCEGL
ncbi:hypothetical protein ScPMuIL_006540 [Solemya velum]